MSDNVTREEQIGLKLPDGTEVYPPDEYRGFPIKDQTDRENFVTNLRGAAADLHFNEDEFLSSFQWVVREKITAVTYDDRCTFPITYSLPDSNPLEADVSTNGEINTERPVTQAAVNGGPVDPIAVSVPEVPNS